MFHLACLSDEEKTDFFLTRMGEGVQHFSNLSLTNNEQVFLLRFSFAPVNADEVAAITRLPSVKEKVLLCGKIEDNAYALAEKMRIRILTGNEVYALLKDKDALPEQYLGDEDSVSKRKRRMELWFSRKNAKPFLVAATLTLLTAFVSPFPYYYFVFGGAMLLTSILIRIFGRR